MTARRGLLAVVAALAIFGTLGSFHGGRADAHPLGNFTINHFARIRPYADVIRMHYVVDMAEIPTFQEIEGVDLNGDGELSESESDAYLGQAGPVLVANLRLTQTGAPLPLRIAGGSAVLLGGQAGLKTLRITLELEATPLGGAPASLEFTDANYPDRLGWREIIVQPGEGVAFEGASVGAASASNELSAYPGDLLSSPLDVRSATFTFTPGTGQNAPGLDGGRTPAAGPIPSGFGGAAFGDLVSADDLTLPVIVLSLLAAYALGAVHALSPGHGKTIVAAYFVGSGGTPRQAILLAATVAVAHTVGVLALGAVTLFASEYIVPEDLYPVLMAGSGLILVAFGLALLVGRLRTAKGRQALHPGGHDHEHQHHHGHDADEMTALEHAQAHLAGQTAAGGMPWRSLLTLGISGGILPSPTALIVLLGAISLHRLGFGLVLIFAFSLGLATVLTGVGLAFVLARRLMARLPVSRRFVGSAPTLAAVAITAGGLLLATRGVLSV